MKPHLVPEVDGTMVLVTQAEIERLTPNSLAQLKKARRKGCRTKHEYETALAQKNGFASHDEYRKSRGLSGSKYQNAWVQKNGFKTFNAYKNAQAQKKGFKTSAQQYSALNIKHARAKQVLKKQMTLPWAGDVKSAYELSARLNKWVGERQWVVDHLVPLMSPFVSGLHVHHNLEIETTELNAVKSNKVWEDMSDVGELDECDVMRLEQAYEAKRQCIEAGKSLKAEAAYLRRLGEIFGAPSGKKKAGIV